MATTTRTLVAAHQAHMRYKVYSQVFGAYICLSVGELREMPDVDLHVRLEGMIVYIDMPF